jgi:hypothetical protein
MIKYNNNNIKIYIYIIQYYGDERRINRQYKRMDKN